MLQNLYRYLFGYLYIEINGVSPERFLNMCVHHQIKIWELESHKPTYVMYIMVKDFKKLRPIIRKTGIKIKILNRFGLPFVFHKYRKRYMFKMGLILTILSLYAYTFFVWDIDISGNQRYSDEEIISFLNEQQIYKTMPVKQIDTGEIVSMIRNQFPEIIWVSTHIEGSKVIIRVKENEQLTQTDSDQELENINVSSGDEEGIRTKEGQDLIAQEDGVIVSIVTSSGIPQVHAGDRVEQGDILILGRIDVSNDDGEVISYNYTQAEGEVILESMVEYSDTLELAYQYKKYLGPDILREYLWFGDYYWQPSSGDGANTFLYESITKEFSLHPSQQDKYKFILGIEIIKEYELVDAQYTNEEIQSILTDRFQIYSEDLTQKKVEIIENNVKIEIIDDVAKAKGSVTVNINNTLLEDTKFLTVPQLDEEVEI